MPTNQYRQRIEGLFADIERLAADPASKKDPAVRRELKALRKRLSELEAMIREDEEKKQEQVGEAGAAQPASGPRQASSIIYEKERLGYV